MRAAVVDGLILTSPCKINGAGLNAPRNDPSPRLPRSRPWKRPCPSISRLIVPLATWCQLRRGELLGLRRSDIDPLHAVISIEQSRTFSMDGTSIVKSPKTASGVRQIAMPKHFLPKVAEHLDRFTESGRDAYVFRGRGGKSLSRDSLQADWERARLTVGRRDLSLHDLRHTGLTLPPRPAATTAELYAPGWSCVLSGCPAVSAREQDRDRVVADALERMVDAPRVVPIARES